MELLCYSLTGHISLFSLSFLLFLAVQNSEGKKLCKYYVQRGLGLASGDHVVDATLKVPLVVCITRLVAQKGLHLITHAIKQVEELVSLLLHAIHILYS